MKLLRFKVRDFRAVVDSEWIECDQITAFVGFNESGKTTMLAALMRLVDQKYGFDIKKVELEPTLANPPKKLVRVYEDVPLDYSGELVPVMDVIPFIEAVFTMDDELNEQIKKRWPHYKPVDTLHIIKTYGAGYRLPDIFTQIDEPDWRELILLVLSKLPSFMYFKEVTEIPSEIDLVDLAKRLALGKKIKLNQRETVFANLLSYLDIWQSNLLKTIVQIYGPFEDMEKNGVQINFQEIFAKIPMFKDRFTRGFKNLTEQFKRWWGNADMEIYYEVYPRGVRIKMTDERGESFLLENRSTGFRRFFALFLAFSVSAKEDFENAILLFDEAGAALHPKMQRKLIAFFSELGKNSQIIYNTHTAYMLPVKDMNRVRISYKDKQGKVRITKDLRMDKDNCMEESLFVSEASLAMYLAQTALVGCLPITVLSADDMYVLQVIRNVLIARGMLDTVHETLIFSAGENGIDSITQLFSANESLPIVMLSAGSEAMSIKNRLYNGTYKNEKHKIFMLSDFYENTKNFIDLLPPSFIKIFALDYVTEILGDGFEYSPKRELYEQIEQYAKDFAIELPAKYRTYLAKSIKINTMIKYKNSMHISGKVLRGWKKMIKALVNFRF